MTSAAAVRSQPALRSKRRAESALRWSPSSFAAPSGYMWCVTISARGGSGGAALSLYSASSISANHGGSIFESGASTSGGCDGQASTSIAWS